MSNYLSPDVYLENKDGPKVDTEIAIGVAGFVGITQRGVLNKGVRISSWNQFISNFAAGMKSPFISSADLAYAVYGFFQNGGSECVIVRTAHSTAAKASAVPVSGFTATLTAKDEGTWGNDLKLSVAANEDTPTNFDATIKIGSTVVEVIKNLCNTSTDSNYWVSRINVESSYVTAGTGPLSVTASDIAFSAGADGVSDIADADFVAALTAFDSFDDLSYIAVPGQTTQAICTGLTAYCTEDKNIVPVLEAPKTANMAAVKALRKTNENETGVLVWPWGYVTDPLSTLTAPNNIRVCPPSGHYMGVMSRIANKRGIWKAPAGTEAVVKGFVSLITSVTKADMDVLNPAGVVSIIAKTNYGIIVWGARSLNSENSSFKYVSDLLLDAYIKRKCRVLGMPYVFEPNCAQTWTSIQTSVAAFMNNLYQKGAFSGTKAADAYYVKCDGDLNNVHVQNNDGIVETEVGYANVKPGEFIVFRFAHDISNS